MGHGTALTTFASQLLCSVVRSLTSSLSQKWVGGGRATTSAVFEPTPEEMVHTRPLC